VQVREKNFVSLCGGDNFGQPGNRWLYNASGANTIDASANDTRPINASAIDTAKDGYAQGDLLSARHPYFGHQL
jgi:hypothetical protein